MASSSPDKLRALAASVDAASPTARADLVKSGEPGLSARGGGGGGGAGWPDAYLDRWLVAEAGDVAKASARLVDHAAWRKALLPDGWTAAKEREIHDELAAGKTWMAPLPAPRGGRPLLITASNKHLRARRDSPAMTLALVYAMDVACHAADAAGGDGKVVSIVDARGVGLAHLDNAVAKLVVDIAQGHYPERAAHTYVFGAPRAFAALIAWLLPFVAPATRGKVTFATAATWAPDTVDPAVLPAELGGRGAAAVPVQAAARAVKLVAGAAAEDAPVVRAPYGVAASAKEGAAGKAAAADGAVALSANATAA